MGARGVTRAQRRPRVLNQFFARLDYMKNMIYYNTDANVSWEKAQDIALRILRNFK